MQPERYQQIEELYHAALRHKPEERQAFLEQACGGDEALRQEVESLLGYDEQAAQFIEKPPDDVAAALLAAKQKQSIAGRTLGHYRVVSLLGAGGMGEVYLAEDTRLRRRVALKLLPAEFTANHERLRRFEQEAQAASALNHPNILTVYEFGIHDNAPYLVSELLEGESLREQLNDGAMSQRKVIYYAQQIAAGLAAAHAKGIVHRDLKPENLFIITDGRVKILDFGLAKLRPQQSGMFGSGMPTQKVRTEPGTVMGTVEYMSPEQVRGQEADNRTDIFAFGVILYEMLCGRRPFTGESAIEVMNAILKEEPAELSDKEQQISPVLDKIVRRCLEKRPERRFQSASDLGFALEALFTPAGSRLLTKATPPVLTGVLSPLRLFGQARLAWAVTAVLSVVTLGMIWSYFTRQPTGEARVMKFYLLPPENSNFGQIAVSPDGRQLAFTAATGGKVQLWVRALDATEARALPGTQGATFPFWSPDSRFIGFYADGHLKKIEVSGGLAQSLCDAANGRGGAWNRDGVILWSGTNQLDRGGGSVLFRISAGGGEVTQVTTRDLAREENSHMLPAFLPDGRHFLYSIRSGQKDTLGVYLGSLDGTVKRRLLGDFGAIRYVTAVTGATAGGGDGWLLFGRDGALLAQPFDARRLQFTGEPFQISEKVGSDPILMGPNPIFSASDNGVLVFDPSFKRQRRQYLWMDRHGQRISSLEVAAGLGQPWLSPDERRFIADRADPQTGSYDLWLCDVTGSNSVRFTFDTAHDFNPIWEPAGDHIVWSSTRDGGIINLYQKAASLVGEDTLLLKSDQNKLATDWSLDGRFLIYRQNDPQTKSDIWVLPMAGNDKAQPFPVLRTEANEVGAALSPDGRWLAYASDASGRYEVYVRSFPGGGSQRQISTDGGNHPRWRRDGRELFYYAADGKIMAVPVEGAEKFDVGAAIALFEFRAGNMLTSLRAPYAVTGDGQRFLLNAVVETEPNAPLTVVVNWAAEVKQ